MATKGKTKTKNDAKKQRKKQFSAIILFAVGLFLVAVSIIPGLGAWEFIQNFLKNIVKESIL